MHSLKHSISFLGKIDKVLQSFTELSALPQQRSHQTISDQIFVSPMYPIQQARISVQDLLGILDISMGRPNSQPKDSCLNAIARDRNLVSSFGLTFTPARQGRVAQVMQDAQFLTWFKSAQSSTLIANGMEINTYWQESVSSMSYMCYLLSQTLSRLKSAKPLDFYCGLHSVPGECLEGVGGMLRSIITQLLQIHQHQINLSFLNFSFIQGLQKHDITYLCFLLESLLQSIGVGVVFLLIDGISFYESETRLEEAHIVMRFLNSLVEAVEASHTGLVLKLLITSPTISRHSKEWFPAAKEVFVPQDMLLDGIPSELDQYQILIAQQNALGAETQMVNYMGM